MSLPSKEFKRLVTISNQVAEYPPLDLTKLQYQALLVLISCIDSTEKPIYSIEDIVEEIKSKGITDNQEQMQYLEDLINRQNTYRIPYKEYLRYFTNGDTPQGSVIQRAMEAVLSLNNKPFKFNNPEFEGSYAWFQAVALDKKNNDLVFVLTSFAKPFLMGMRRDFLQMLAESTMNFDGKYSVPIFLYLKSKLFDGRQEYHSSEPLEVFKRRFGLDGVKTYEKFYDFQRRILDVAEKDSTQSGDIRFVFTGKADAGSKKIMDLQYSIYRIGSIKSSDAKIASLNSGISNTNNEITKKRNNEIKTDITHKDKLFNLTDAQKRTYVFLSEVGINKGFIVDTILVHPALKYEILRGYEDIYFKMLWQWFLKKTKSSEKAAAFVAWWKNGRLTRDTVHWQIVEGVRQYIKNQERKQGTIFDQNNEITKKRNNEITPNEVGQGSGFNIEQFKKTHAEMFKQISMERTVAFENFREAPNYTQLLKNSIASHCQEWWQRQ
jgi:Initiator Replication protein